MDVPDIVECATDLQLLGLTLSPCQRALLRSIYGLQLNSEERDLWHLCTGRDAYPARAFQEVTVIAGAGSGKDSRIAAPIAVYEACFGRHERYLGKGERGTVAVVAQDAKATKVAFRYIKNYLTTSPLLKALVAEEREAEIWLTNGLDVETYACTAKSLRGRSNPVGILDELAFFRVSADAADADAEIQTALRRGMIRFPEPRLVKISTPYLRAGVLHEDFVRAFGKDDPDALVWRASTQLMHPGVNDDRLARQQRVDPGNFAREYLAEFSDDVEAYLPHAWIAAATIEGRFELPPIAGARRVATVDPSGGAVKGDAFSLTIVRVDAGPRFVQEVMKAWTSSRTVTVDLATICREIAEICGRYGVTTVLGDHYAGLWPAQEFQRAGLFYKQADLDKSKCYRELEPVMAQGRIELLDHPVQLRELRSLERRFKPGGKTPTIDHPRGGHDDCSNALALAVAELSRSMSPAVAVMFDPAEERHATAAPESVEPGGGFWGTRPADAGSGLARRFGGASGYGNLGRSRRGFPW